MSIDFDTALQGFLVGAQKIIADHFAARHPNLKVPTLGVDRGSKNLRIVLEEDGRRSVFCFIDRKTGDVLKAAGWKAPAKGVRGNILNPETNGLERITPYGTEYNK
jgi:hypothetical protein